MTRKKLSLPAAALAVACGGLLTVAPARAQAGPPPVIGPAIAGCAVLAGLSPCLGTVVPLSPVIIPGFGGALRNVDVDKDVDRTRTPGRLVVSQ